MRVADRSGGWALGRVAGTLAVIATALAFGSAGVSAAPRPRSVQGGIVSTVAGGVGGPGPATAVSLGAPCGLSVDAGNLYVGGRGAVREISERTGELTTPAGDFGYEPYFLHSGEGGLAADAPLGACGISHDAAGNLVIADGSANAIRVVAEHTGTIYGRAMTAGHIYRVAGDGGPAIDAETYFGGLTPDPAGNLLIRDYSGRIRQITN